MDMELLVKEVKAIYLESGCRYGYRRIGARLRALNFTVSNPTVLKAMRLAGICGKQGIKPAGLTYETDSFGLTPYWAEHFCRYVRRLTGGKCEIIHGHSMNCGSVIVYVTGLTEVEVAICKDLEENI